MYIYSNPHHEHCQGEFPDIEVFFGYTEDDFPEDGWYFWACFPGCLPNSLPTGPFETEEEAVEEAQIMFGTE